MAFRLNALGEIEVRTLTAVIAFLLSLPVSGSTPIEVWFDNAGTFDANRILSGVFTASGAFDAQGSQIDSPRFTGQAIHITRTMLTTDGEQLVIAVNANHVTGIRVVPVWCAPPETIPPGTLLFPESGNWRVLSGTGKFAGLNGTGSWASWVVFDPVLGLPVSATECMDGKVQID
jgi:hypothetical protein